MGFDSGQEQIFSLRYIVQTCSGAYSAFTLGTGSEVAGA
jgi:hypothetical protein